MHLRLESLFSQYLRSVGDSEFIATGLFDSHVTRRFGDERKIMNKGSTKPN